MDEGIVFYLLATASAFSLIYALGLGNVEPLPIMGWVAAGVAGLQAIAWFLIAILYEEVTNMKQRSQKVSFVTYDADKEELEKRLKKLEEKQRCM